MHLHKALAWHTWGINYTLKRCMWAMRALVCFCISDCVNMCCCWFIYISNIAPTHMHAADATCEALWLHHSQSAILQLFNIVHARCSWNLEIPNPNTMRTHIPAASYCVLFRTYICVILGLCLTACSSLHTNNRLFGYVCVYVCVSRCSREFKCDVCAKPRAVDASRWFSSERAPPSREGFHISSAELNSIRRPFPEHK